MSRGWASGCNSRQGALPPPPLPPSRSLPIPVISTVTSSQLRGTGEREPPLDPRCRPLPTPRGIALRQWRRRQGGNGSGGGGRGSGLAVSTAWT